MCELCEVSECIPGKAICAECHIKLEVFDLELFVHDWRIDGDDAAHAI